MAAKELNHKSKRRNATLGRGNGNKVVQPAEMSMKAIEQKWPDRWVLIEVTQEEEGQASAGRVLGHGARRAYQRLSKLEVAWHKDHPAAETFLFWTGELIPQGVHPVL